MYAFIIPHSQNSFNGFVLVTIKLTNIYFASFVNSLIFFYFLFIYLFEVNNIIQFFCIIFSMHYFIFKIYNKK